MRDGRERLALFEQHRLDLFDCHGFAGETRWLTDSYGRRTAAVAGGDGERPVVLLHGGLSQAGEWALIAGKVPGRLVIPDWPGCGLSDPVGIRRVGLRPFGVQWLAAIVDALGVDQVDIVGSSTGGYIGLAFALAQPHRVRRLVQVGAPPGLRRTAPVMFRLFATPGLGPFLLRRQPEDAEANRTQVFSNLVAHPERIPIDMLGHDLEAMALPNAVESAVDFSRSLVHPITGLRRQVLIDQDLASLTVPTLCLWGADDNFVKPDTVTQTLQRTAAIRLQTVDDAGHLLTFEQPDIVANVITEFLEANS